MTRGGDRDGKGERKKVLFGNYPNYYGYRRENQFAVLPSDPLELIQWASSSDSGSSMEDTRLEALLSSKLFMQSSSGFKSSHSAAGSVFRVLDIGCNDGTVTLELAEKLNSICRGSFLIHGLDIDSTLILKARKKLNHLNSRHSPLEDYSREQPSSSSSSSSSSSINNEECTPIPNQQLASKYYFPRSFGKTFGAVPVVPHPFYDLNLNARENVVGNEASSLQWSLLPVCRKVHFKCLDFVDPISIAKLSSSPSHTSSSNAPISYNLILALSITKWIHLNHGDQGLKTFLAHCQKVLAKEEESRRSLLVLEPQPWSSYQGKSRLDEKLRHNYQNNCRSFRSEDDWRLELELAGLELNEILHQSKSTNGGGAGNFLKRPIYICSLIRQRKEAPQ